MKTCFKRENIQQLLDGSHLCAVHADHTKEKGWSSQWESFCHGQEMSFITHVRLHPASSGHDLNLTCDAGKVKRSELLMMSSHECLDGELPTQPKTHICA